MNNRTFLPVNCWAAEDIPTNKLIDGKPEYMSNAELLSVIIGTGSDRESSVDLARRLLSECDNNLSSLAKMCKDPNNLTHLHGIGKQKAAKIIAAIELGARRQYEQAAERPGLESATRIYNLVAPFMRDLEKEEFWVLLMNQNYRLLKRFCLSKGGYTEVMVDIRIIMREALLNNATVLAVCHNHPSGSLRPSKMDDQITQAIRNACETMRIHFYDHVIVTDGAYFSYHEQGRL